MAKSFLASTPRNSSTLISRLRQKAQAKKWWGWRLPTNRPGCFYTTTPLSKQAADLVDMLDNTGKIVEMSKKLNDSYFRQDVEGLLRLTEDDDSDPRFMEALLDKRNAAWIEKLPDIMNQGSSFIAVGALHLPGEKGVVEGLRRLGYTIEPVWK